MAAKKPVKAKAKAKKKSGSKARKGGRKPEAKKKKARTVAKRRAAKAVKPKKAKARATAKAKKRPAAKKRAKKKASPKKRAAKRPASKKAAAKKKRSAKKRPVKKAAAKKRVAKKAGGKKRSAKKLASKKRASKKSAAKRRTAKKPAAKKRVAKKAARTVAKRKAPAKKKVALTPSKLKLKLRTAPAKLAPPARKAKDVEVAEPVELAEDALETAEPKSEGKAKKLRPRESKRAARAAAPGRDQNGSPKARSSAKERREPPRTPTLVSLPLPILPPVKRPSVEERSASIEIRLNAQSEDFRRRYIESFDMSWIYHDSALEGVVYTFEELRAALAGQPAPVADSTLQPTCDDIRRHKEAIDFVRDFATKKRLPVTLDIVKKIYLILRPEEGDVKTVKYRKDVPQHRLYFHEYAPPDKIAYKVRQIVDWLNDPETKKTRNGVRIAARAHYDMLRVFPFPTESGKVARLFMNLLLLRSGLPPSIIHSTERQRYYEALKGSATTVLQMVQESVENALSSVEKLLDEHETRTRAFVS